MSALTRFRGCLESACREHTTVRLRRLVSLAAASDTVSLTERLAIDDEALADLLLDNLRQGSTLPESCLKLGELPLRFDGGDLHVEELLCLAERGPAIRHTNAAQRRTTIGIVDQGSLFHDAKKRIIRRTATSLPLDHFRWL